MFQHAECAQSQLLDGKGFPRFAVENLNLSEVESRLQLIFSHCVQTGANYCLQVQHLQSWKPEERRPLRQLVSQSDPSKNGCTG